MKILLFGATGSAGGSVLRACLAAPAVEEVRAIARRPPALAHGKLRVFLHQDFLDFAPVAEAFAGVDACLFCLGISVTQVSGEAEYRRITHDFALAAAHALKAQSPGAAFHFISGQGTRLDSRFLWARVKAETERELIDLVDATCWRPAAIDGERSQSGPRLYQAARPLLRLLKPFRSLYVAGEDLGRAMLQATSENIRGRVIENAEIRDLADRARLRKDFTPERGEGREER
jgi:uncharacterized protein YbjT (DUF2867 family)